MTFLHASACTLGTFCSLSCRAATHCNTLQHTATCCNMLQHVLLLVLSRCNTLQHTATHCNTLQHTATHCNTLQHTATCCNTFCSLSCRGSQSATFTKRKQIVATQALTNQLFPILLSHTTTAMDLNICVHNINIRIYMPWHPCNANDS